MHGFPRWNEIETVLLDMDGTLLDLRFDNYFWLEVVPERYAHRHALTLEQAHAALVPRFAAKQGTLDWYCTDYWSRELDLDVAGLKHELREHVRFLPGAEEFLEALRSYGIRTALVTNAHRDSLAVKEAQTALSRYFDTVISSHDLGAPKEHPQFWVQLQSQLRFDAQRSLFIDDSAAVLAAARRHRIAQILAVARPDSTQTTRTIADFPAVEGVGELLDDMRRQLGNARPQAATSR